MQNVEFSQNSAFESTQKNDDFTAVARVWLDSSKIRTSRKFALQKFEKSPPGRAHKLIACRGLRRYPHAGCTWHPASRTKPTHFSRADFAQVEEIC